jgi:hypothetical protein
MSTGVLSERAQGTNLLYCTSRWMFKSRYYHFMTGVMNEGTILGASWPLVLDQQINGRDMTDAECGAHTSTRPISLQCHSLRYIASTCWVGSFKIYRYIIGGKA